MDEHNWQAAWQPLIDAVGTEFGDTTEVWGADEVEKGLIRRFLEPLEFDCPLHYDRDTAQRSGYSDIVAPVSSLMSWAIAPLWHPGQHIWSSAERNAQPSSSPVASSRNDPMLQLMPNVPGFFATDIEIDYFQSVVIGDRLRMQGRKLVSCVPKETSVGRGAFVVWEAHMFNQRGEVVARTRTGMYYYEPRVHEVQK